jgi:hypothetical protein
VILVPTLKSQLLRRPLAAFIALFASAIFALAIDVSSASAEAPEGLSTAPPAAAPIPAKEVSETAANAAATAVPAEAPAPSAEPQPAEATEATEVTDAAQAAVTSAADEPVASARSNVPVSTSTSTVDAVGQSATETAASASTAATSAGRAGAEQEAVIAPAAKHDVPTLAESVRRDSAERIAKVRRSSTESVAALTDRIPNVPDAPSPSSLLNLLNPPSAESPLSTPGPLQSEGRSPWKGALGFPGIHVGSFLRWTPIASLRYIGGALRLQRVPNAEGVDARPGSAKVLETVLPATVVAHAGADSARAAPRAQGPAPLDAPPPSPNSPAAIAPGSGDAFFVPFAALLALLALVAPASRRRLREAPEFRPPIPFVCALERPG